MNRQVNYIKESISPLDFYLNELPGTTFKRNTWNLAGCCPFHADKKPGSFFVNIETGAFKCFSCDSAGGDIIAYTMTLHGIQFTEALDRLVTDWGL